MLIKNLIDFLKDKSYRNLVLSTLFVILGGMFLFHYIEGWKWIDALYFSVITLTTVGYGDLAPQTDLGKIISIFYIFSGIGIIFGFINAFYQHRISNIDRSRKRFNRD